MSSTSTNYSTFDNVYDWEEIRIQFTDLQTCIFDKDKQGGGVAIFIPVYDDLLVQHKFLWCKSCLVGVGEHGKQSELHPHTLLVLLLFWELFT